MFDRLDFLYLPSRDVAADLDHYVTRLGAEVVFAVQRFATRVAMIRLASQGPDVLLAEHLEGDAPVLIFRVDDLADAVTRLGLDQASRFEFPFGEGVLLATPVPQRMAIYERTHEGRGDSLTGRRDF